jgi:hypothetical protein
MPSKPEILRDLGDGLILRRARKSDKRALAEFNAKVHDDQGIKYWVYDLMNGKLPTFQPGDFTIVEDTQTGQIVSSLNLISQTWAYEGIPFGVGRPELVGTLKEYRNRGLIRAQFEVIHQWSAERGERVQAITGIPYYYRLFGYEMALDLGGWRIGYPPHIPQLKKGEKEAYRIRPAKEEDIPFLMALYEENHPKRYAITCVREEWVWQHDVLRTNPRAVNYGVFRIIETLDGEAVGFLIHPRRLWEPTMACTGYELKAGVSYGNVTPSVVRYLAKTGERYAQRDKKKFGAWGFDAGREHPVHTAVWLSTPRVHNPYAWYIRVADIPGFIQHVAPALEARLAQSNMAGHTGEVKVCLYSAGFKLVLDKGKLSLADWQPTPEDGGQVAFSGLTFIQLLFGYRTLQELRDAYADVWVQNDEALGLMYALFPKKPAHVWAIA